MVVNWGIISFGFVSITAGMTMPISAQGMYCLSEKKKGQIENYKCSTFFNQLQPVNHCSHNDLSVAK